tara:strand:- start:81 stop:497 length:417 start_codon:yes stop_codon:yes gene_type:complete
MGTKILLIGGEPTELSQIKLLLEDQKVFTSFCIDNSIKPDNLKYALDRITALETPVNVGTIGHVDHGKCVRGYSPHLVFINSGFEGYPLEIDDYPDHESNNSSSYNGNPHSRELQQRRLKNHFRGGSVGKGGKVKWKR